MALSKEQVEKLADLAKLELTPAEVETYQHQLEDVLHYVEKINELDLENVPLSLTGVSEHDVAAPRPDVVDQQAEDMVHYACQKDDSFIVSPKVLKK